jgi:hypothetical protein
MLIVILQSCHQHLSVAWVVYALTRSQAISTVNIIHLRCGKYIHIAPTVAPWCTVQWSVTISVHYRLIIYSAEETSVLGYEARLRDDLQGRQTGKVPLVWTGASIVFDLVLHSSKEMHIWAIVSAFCQIDTNPLKYSCITCLLSLVFLCCACVLYCRNCASRIIMLYSLVFLSPRCRIPHICKTKTESNTKARKSRWLLLTHRVISVCTNWFNNQFIWVLYFRGLRDSLCIQAFLYFHKQH